jgi:hypothetical protein
VIWVSYRGREFPWKLAAGIAAFEFSVNMLYMTTQMKQHGPTGEHSFFSILAAVHGMISLLIFAMFVVLIFLAYFAQRRGESYFRDRPALTWTFVSLWTLSVGSGEVFYLLRYA